MAKKKKRAAQQKEHAAATQKSEHPKKYIAEKNKRNENEPATYKDSATHLLFGHTKINKKDIIEIIIAITFVAFLVFMHLKRNDII